MWQLHNRYPIICTDADWPIIVGVIIVGFGLLLELIALLNFRRLQTTVNPLKPENTSTLANTGVYALSRNPMYLGMAIMLVGAALILRCLTPMIMPLVFCLVVTAVQILPEEKALTKLFGEDYRNYMRAVNRWI